MKYRLTFERGAIYWKQHTEEGMLNELETKAQHDWLDLFMLLDDISDGIPLQSEFFICHAYHFG